MSVLGPKLGDDAPAVVDRLETVAREDPDAFDAEAVAVTVPGRADPVTVSTEHVEVVHETVTEHGEQVRPHVAEPAFGIDRVVYAALAHTLRRDRIDDEERTYLSLDPAIAPTLAAVFPLTDAVESRAREIVDRLERAGLAVDYDDSGSIGRRYRRQDEVGTPYCVTVDERTPDEDTVTIRERDSTNQVRVAVEDLPRILRDLEDSFRSFDEVREAATDDAASE
jgi:glycyl-tRNA synthetase